MSDAAVTETTETQEVETQETQPELSREDRLQALEDAFHKRGEIKHQETLESLEQEAPTAEEVVDAAEGKETEEAQTEESVTSEQEDEFTKRFAQLTKMEANLRAREDKLKQYDDSLKELDQLRELKTLAKTDPLKVAESLGLSVHDLAEQTINGETFSEKKKVNELEERIKKFEQMTQEAEEAKKREAQEEAARQYVDGIKANIDAVPDKYPLVRQLSGGMQLVINTISEYYQRSGEELPWDRAAQMTEDYLVDQKVKEYQVLTKIDKIKEKLGLESKKEEPKPTKQQEVPKSEGRVKNITNAMASAPAAKEVGKPTREERERRIRELADNLFT